MQPGLLYPDIITVISLSLAFIGGTAGLPHVMMRFFTVPDGVQARRSAAWAMGIISYFQLMVLIIGLGAIVLLTDNPEFTTGGLQVIGGNNMAAIHLSRVIGGNIFMGFICAVAFATILAVVSGLMLSAATTISHDLFAGVIRKGSCTDAEELRVSRLTVILVEYRQHPAGDSVQGQNVAVLAHIAPGDRGQRQLSGVATVHVLERIYHPGGVIWRLYRTIACRQPDHPGAERMGKRAGLCGTGISLCVSNAVFHGRVLPVCLVFLNYG